MASSENIFCKVSRIKVSREGYAPDGRYFGAGERLFRSEQWDDTGYWREEFFRASDYQEARERCKRLGWKVSR